MAVDALQYRIVNEAALDSFENVLMGHGQHAERLQDTWQRPHLSCKSSLLLHTEMVLTGNHDPS